MMPSRILLANFTGRTGTLAAAGIRICMPHLGSRYDHFVPSRPASSDTSIRMLPPRGSTKSLRQSSSASLSSGQGALYQPTGLRRAHLLVRKLLNHGWTKGMLGAGSVLTSATNEATFVRFESIAAAAAADFSQGSDYSAGGSDEDEKPQAEQSLRERLDYRPKLSLLDNFVSVAIPAAVCGILYWITKPVHISFLYAAGMSMIMAAWVLICRALLQERYYSARLVPEVELGQKDSKFARVEGVHVHYKSKTPASGDVRAAMHCYHGFGANTGSWTGVQARMADQLGAHITAHDMPGFGLTERPAHAHGYGLDFNARLGRQILERETAQSSHGHPSVDLQPPKSQKASEGKNGGPGPTSTPLRTILMGHSLGGACAASEAIKHPQGINALILVAPAVMAFKFLKPANSGNTGQASAEGATVIVNFHSGASEKSPVASTKRPSPDNRVLRLAIAFAQSFMAAISGLTTRLLQPITVITLRKAVRNRAFWEKGLARAWYDKTRLTQETVDLYRQPQLVRGWEQGLVKFASARMAGGRSFSAVLSDAWNGIIQPTQVELLAAAVVKHNLKVLIVHGENDRLVPASNSRRLATLLPNSKLVIIPETGHVPHEERPQEFLDAVQSFLDDSK